ncbi:MAG: hypothetical protein O3C63_05415 [Cyanobacteria bacterium]|nr:hypothetical protein [Cyanobacteriota bacterium]
MLLTNLNSLHSTLSAHAKYLENRTESDSAVIDLPDAEYHNAKHDIAKMHQETGLQASLNESLKVVDSSENKSVIECRQRPLKILTKSLDCLIRMENLANPVSGQSTVKVDPQFQARVTELQDSLFDFIDTAFADQGIDKVDSFTKVAGVSDNTVQLLNRRAIQMQSSRSVAEAI